MDLYEILGVKKSATLKEIKNAYRKKAVENHPDKEGGSPEKMAAINHAKDILSDQVRRERYDRTGMDSKEPSFDQRFQQTMDNLLMQIIQQPANNPEKVDIIGLMKESIQTALDGHIKKKNIIVAELHRTLSIKKRVKSKDKTIQMVLDIQISKYNKVLAKVSDDAKYCEECLEFLKKYAYEYEPTAPKGFTTIIIS